MQYQFFHDEVLKELTCIGNPTLGSNIGIDRKSALTYCGVRVPMRRKLVVRGFSFYSLDESEILKVWDDLWMHSTNGDVMFCALDYYRTRVRKNQDFEYWKVMCNWIARIENWAHSDDLSSIYSWLLESNFDEIYTQFNIWNAGDDLWKKRISIVSLIHYSGKNAVFLEPQFVLPLVGNCIADHRPAIQKATGWVLREMYRKYPEEVSDFLTENFTKIGSVAWSRAIAYMSSDERIAWRQMRKQRI